MDTVRTVLTAVMAIAVSVPCPAAKDEAPGFGTRLERAVSNPTEWPTIRVEASGRLAKDVHSLTVYGRGIGIWNGERQFTLKDEELGEILELLVKGGVADMPELIGGEEEDDEGDGHEKPLDRHPPRGEAPRYLLRTLTVTVGDSSRTVIQEAEVPEARPFVTLLSRLVELCRKPAAGGVVAPDLATGLKMVAEGTLAPETLTVFVNAPQLRSLPSQEGQGWILDIRHGWLEDATQVLGRGVVHKRKVRMAPEDVRKLAASLLKAGAASLPARINTPGYTQLTVKVLDQKVSVMARTYAVQPDAAAKKEAETFARVRRILAGLHVPAPGMP